MLPFPFCLYLPIGSIGISTGASGGGEVPNGIVTRTDTMWASSLPRNIKVLNLSSLTNTLTQNYSFLTLPGLIGECNRVNTHTLTRFLRANLLIIN